MPHGPHFPVLLNPPPNTHTHTLFHTHTHAHAHAQRPAGPTTLRQRWSVTGSSRRRAMCTGEWGWGWSQRIQAPWPRGTQALSQQCVCLCRVCRGVEPGEGVAPAPASLPLHPPPSTHARVRAPPQHPNPHIIASCPLHTRAAPIIHIT